MHEQSGVVVPQSWLSNSKLVRARPLRNAPLLPGPLSNGIPRKLAQLSNSLASHPTVHTSGRAGRMALLIFYAIS